MLNTLISKAKNILKSDVQADQIDALSAELKESQDKLNQCYEDIRKSVTPNHSIALKMDRANAMLKDMTDLFYDVKGTL